MDLKLTNFFERGFRKNKDQILKKIVSVSSHDYLMNNLSGNIIVPYNTWSISPQGMMVIINHILINDVKTIVEFGTGISTVFLNNLSIKNNLNLKIISIDHDAKWQNTVKEKYQAKNVEYIHAELDTKLKFKNQEYLWYNLDALKNIEKQKVDFMIVDAPIGSKSLYERAGAFEFFKNELDSDKLSCFLDDTNEDYLKEIIFHYCSKVKSYPTFSISSINSNYETEPVIFTK